MRSDAKASTAGSTQRQAPRIALPAFVAALLALLVFAVPASATKTHLFLETFGSAAQPSFTSPRGIAIDQSSGDVLVMDAGSPPSIKRFNPDGTPADFSGLGSNAIDGEGTGNCATVPADCDQTPQNGLSFFAASESQIAVDNSGGATDGNVYVTQSSPKAINVFSAAGEYLGQLSESSGGPFSEACGVAVDPSGAVYVGDFGGGIHKFVPAANPPVNADYTATFSSVLSPCTLAAGAGPTAGFLFPATWNGTVKKIDSGTGALEYTVSAGATTTVTVDPASGEVYAAAGASVGHYNASGASSASLVQELSAGSEVNGVALRGSNANLYLDRAGSSTIDVYRALIVPTVLTGSASNLTATSATLNGTVNPDGEAITECLFEYGTSTAYGQTAPCAESPGSIGSGTSPVPVHADISGLSVGTEYHFRLIAKNAEATGQGGDEAFLTKGPLIKESWAEAITSHEALLKAKINPQGAATSYRFEWGTDASYGQSSPEGSVGSDSTDHLVLFALEGLQPGTTYHWRVLATNSDGTTKGPDRTFTTFEPLAPQTDCANQALRVGPAAALPDCRAYEMVTPVDKSGADVQPAANSFNYDMGSEQAALDGEKMAYATAKPFGDAASNLFPGTQYIASRGAGGWSSHAITPPHENNLQIFASIYPAPGRYSAFSEDLSTGFLYDDAKPPLTLDAMVGANNYYLRNNTTETYEALTTEILSGNTNLGGMGFMGYSEDGSHTIFAARAQLTPDAKPGDSTQLYDYHDGELELVSILPGGGPATGASAGAGGNAFYNDETGETRNAISSDGSRIFWTTYATESENINTGTGKIYARLDGEATIPISESVSPAANAAYWAAADDGSQVIFSAGTDLYRFDVDSETPTLIAGEVSATAGVLGASEDASAVYFLSQEVLAAGATAGEPNLYLDQGGTKTFIATLAAADESSQGHTAANGAAESFDGVTRDFSQVTPDGSHVVFDSRASLTGYDNTSLETGKAAIEVYRYDAASEQLTCISCNPSGGRPETERLPDPHAQQETAFLNAEAAAWLPTPRRGTYNPRMVAEDGNRVFFNSFDSLVPQDTNGVQDVYQWEAQGVGSCEEAGGCVRLISTGTNPKPSTFIDASEGGRDVFFRTSAGIDPRDPGLIDIYDARSGGGFPPPASPPECFGDACQSPPSAPIDPTPASAGFRGAGNPTPAKPRRSCRSRGRHGKKGAKAKKSKKSNKRCKRNNRRAGR